MKAFLIATILLISCVSSSTKTKRKCIYRASHEDKRELTLICYDIVTKDK